MKIRNFVVWLMTFLVALPSLAIGGLIIAPKAMAASVDHVVISQIQVHGSSATDEFVELYNPTNSPINIGNWEVQYKTATDGSWSAKATITNGVTIAAYHFYLLGTADFTSVSADFSTMTSGLSDTAGHVRLHNGMSVIDLVGYGAAADSAEGGHPASAPGNGKSISRRVDSNNYMIDSGDNLADFADPATSAPRNSSTILQPTTPVISSLAATGGTVVSGYINGNNTGAHVSGTVTADTGGAQTIEFFLGGSPFATPFTSPIAQNVTGFSMDFPSSAYSELIASEGTKQITAKVTDHNNNVSGASTAATITVDKDAPVIPDTTKITLAQNAPGTNDTATGVTAGAVENNATVKIYSDAALTNLITSGIAGATGTFAAISIGDNANADIYIVAVDAAGNVSPSLHLTNDIAAPTSGSVIINSGATIASSNTVALTIAATDAGSGLDMMMQFSNDNTTWSDWVVYANSQLTYALTSGNGDKTVYAKFKDKAGNISGVISSAITVNSGAENIKVADIISGAQTITPTDDVVLNITATGTTTLTKANYIANPQSAMASGLTAMIGKYLEFAITDTSKITWPIEIKVYFTQDDLTNANIGSTSQIKGLYFWDNTTSTWKLYEGTDGSTGVTTPSDKTGYLGYVWAKVNHFTPMVIGLDLSAPSAPASFSATVGDEEISLSWSKIDDAAGYYVRYRQAGTEVYTTVYLTGIDSTSTKITGLVNGTEYEFGVAAMDNASNISGYSTVKVTPTPPAPTPAPPLPTTITPAVGGYHPLEKLIPKAKAAEPTEEGKVKAEETTVETRNWVRILVSLAVLIIIAGAGFAAYAIYEWWVEGKGKDDKKEEEEIKFEIKTEKEKKKRGRKKKNNRSDRW